MLRFRSSLLVIFAFLAPASVAAQQVPPQASPQDIQTLFGIPAAVTEDGDKVTWRYGGPTPTTVVFVDGRSDGGGRNSRQSTWRRSRQIRVRNALNPSTNPWAAAAQAMTESLAASAVGNLQKQLAETPPFLSRPVHLPYTAYRVKTKRVLSVRASASAADKLTAFGDTLPVSVEVNAITESIEGAIDNDSAGLRNSATATSVEDLSDELILELNGNLSRAVSELGERLFLARAAHSANSKRPAVETLGNLSV